jgi:hypothetical protein
VVALFRLLLQRARRAWTARALMGNPCRFAPNRFESDAAGHVQGAPVAAGSGLRFCRFAPNRRWAFVLVATRRLLLQRARRAWTARALVGLCRGRRCREARRLRSLVPRPRSRLLSGWSGATNANGPTSSHTLALAQDDKRGKWFMAERSESHPDRDSLRFTNLVS